MGLEHTSSECVSVKGPPKFKLSLNVLLKITVIVLSDE